MNIAIIGGTGLLGSNLVALYKSKKLDVKAFSRSVAGNIDPTYNQITNFENLEFELNTAFVSWKPDIIINAIALVNLSECENRKEYCHKTNVKIAETLAIIAKKQHSYYIHISTDHYYKDNKEKHTETDPIILLNYYSTTKREAEEKVLHLYKDSLVVRTNIIGFRKSKTFSFFEWLHNALEKEIEINLFYDFYTSVISVKELGVLLLKCYDNRLFGIYNIASSEVVDKYSFGMQVAKKFKLSNNLITKSSFDDFQREDNLKRASNLGLDVSKIEKALNLHMPSIDKTISTLLNEYKESLNSEKRD